MSALPVCDDRQCESVQARLPGSWAWVALSLISSMGLAPQSLYGTMTILLPVVLLCHASVTQLKSISSMCMLSFRWLHCSTAFRISYAKTPAG